MKTYAVLGKVTKMLMLAVIIMEPNVNLKIHVLKVTLAPSVPLKVPVKMIPYPACKCCWTVALIALLYYTGVSYPKLLL